MQIARGLKIIGHTGITPFKVLHTIKTSLATLLSRVTQKPFQTMRVLMKERIKEKQKY